jgi:hypothetical protein
MSDLKARAQSEGVVEAYTQIKQEVLKEWIKQGEDVEVHREMLDQAEDPQTISDLFEAFVIATLERQLREKSKAGRKRQRKPTLRNGLTSA